MSEPLPGLHHVVFCVKRAHQDAAAEFWRDLGFELVEIGLAEDGLRVLLDWDRGIEIIAPDGPAGPAGAAAQRFLDDRGEGVYSIVIRTTDVVGPLTIAARHGVTVEFAQHRSDGYELDEAMLSPVHGMPVTFLATDLP